MLLASQENTLGLTLRKLKASKFFALHAIYREFTTTLDHHITFGASIRLNRKRLKARQMCRKEFRYGSYDTKSKICYNIITH